MSIVSSGPGTGHTEPETTIEDAIEEGSIGRDFVRPLGSGDGLARNSIVVDSENSYLSGLRMDPIRQDAVAYWAFFRESNEPNEYLRWAREDIFQSFVEENAKISNIEYRVASDDTTPSPSNPYGIRTETIRVTYKDLFIEAGMGTDAFVEYLRSRGFATPGYEYLDHALEYKQAYSSKESQIVYRGSPPSSQLSAGVKFDYNFYIKQYEESVDRFNIPETLYPHIYTFYLEKERGLSGGDSSFYGDEIDVGFTEPRINQDGYVDQWIYNDFITLNRASEMRRVFINSIRETSFSTDKIGEIDRGEYYDIWSNRYPEALAGSVETTSGATQLSNGVSILSEKYSNILIPLTTEDRIHTSYNSYKELFPIFTEIEYSQTLPNETVDRLTAEEGNLPIFNNLMRDCFSDFKNLLDSATIPGSVPSTFSIFRGFSENHEQFYRDSLDNLFPLPTGGSATRRVFDIAEWATGEDFVDFDDSTYLFLNNFTGELAESTLSDLILITRNADLIEDSPSGLADLSANIRTVLLDLYNDNRRTYEDIMSGNRAYSEDLFFKISKYVVSPEGSRGSSPVQNFYLINNSHNRSMVNLIDTQLKYGTSYEYEIHTCRLVLGTKTRIASSRYFEPEAFSPRTDGEPGFRVTGHFRPVTMGEVTFLESDESPTITVGGTAPIGPGGGPGSGGTAGTSVGGVAVPSEFLSEGEQIYLVDVDIELTPSIKIIELPYVSSLTSGINVLRGTVLDDPPMPPEVEMYPYRGVSDKLLFLLNTGAGSREYEPISFTPQEQMYVNRLRSMNVDPNKVEILYENDDPSTLFQIYRMDRRPTSYEQFNDNLLAVVDTRDTLIDFRHASSTSYKSDVIPNKKYYYMFRAVDVHGHYSYPSPVYEIELVDDDGAVYPVMSVVEMEENQRRKSKTKKLNRFLRIQPSFLQSVLDSQDSSIADSNTVPRDGIPVGVQTESVWDKTFKIRLTSKKTGRKVDLNIKCKKEYDDTRPPEMPDLSISGVNLPTGVAPFTLSGRADLIVWDTLPAPTVAPGLPSAAPGPGLSGGGGLPFISGVSPMLSSTSSPFTGGPGAPSATGQPTAQNVSPVASGQYVNGK